MIKTKWNIDNLSGDHYLNYNATYSNDVTLIEFHVQSNHVHLDHHMVTSCAGIHMDNKGTRLKLHADPQSPRHVTSTPTPWLQL